MPKPERRKSKTIELKYCRGSMYNNMLLWDTVKGPPPDLKGKTSLLLLVALLWALQFTHYTPTGQRYSPPPHGMVIAESRQYH